jgi:hypothetical protein
VIVAAPGARGMISYIETVVLPPALFAMSQAASLTFADCLGNLDRHIVTAKWRAQLHATG